jgi:hypothetical protein
MREGHSLGLDRALESVGLLLASMGQGYDGAQEHQQEKQLHRMI